MNKATHLNVTLIPNNFVFIEYDDRNLFKSSKNMDLASVKFLFNEIYDLYVARRFWVEY